MIKKRENQKLPANFWAKFLDITSRLFPNATFDREQLEDLYSMVLEEWQNGRQLHVIVREVCSCDGRKIFPSEGARQRIQRQRELARAPQDAQPGEVFGLEQLRDPGALARLKLRVAMLSARIKKASEGIPILRKRLEGAKDQKRVDALLDGISNAEKGIQALIAERDALVRQENKMLAPRRWSITAPETPPIVVDEAVQADEEEDATALAAKPRPRKAPKPRAPKQPKQPKQPKPRKARAQPQEPASQGDLFPSPQEELIPDDLAGDFINQLARKS